MSFFSLQTFPFFGIFSYVIIPLFDWIGVDWRWWWVVTTNLFGGNGTNTLTSLHVRS